MGWGVGVGGNFVGVGLGVGGIGVGVFEHAALTRMKTSMAMVIQFRSLVGNLFILFSPG